MLQTTQLKISPSPPVSQFYPMDQQNPTPTPTAPPATAETSAAVAGSQPQPQPQPQPQSQLQPPQPQPQPQPPPPVLPPSSTPSPSTSSTVPPSPNPKQSQNQNPRPNTQLPLQHSQSLPSRPPATLARTWQQSHLPPSSTSSGPTPSSSSPTLPSASSPAPAQPPRGGIALGVPAHRPSPSPSSPASFSPSYGHFGGLGRSGINLPEPSSNSSASQVRPSMQGVQGMGMLGSLSSSSQMRPSGIPQHHQQRPVQSSLRPVSTPSNQLSSPQNYQGPGLLRVSSAASPASPSPSTPQSVLSINQPWLASGSQGKPPLPSPSYRQPVNSQSLQQRSHIQQQQHHSLPMTSQQQHMTSSQQQQPSPSPQTHEHYGQQAPPSRVSQTLSHQQQSTRVQGSTNQKSSTPASVQLSTLQSVSQNRVTTAETDESCNRILSKRSIHELVNQIDPSEKLDPEVEDILMDIADEFVESITTFGCSLAKHRKSTTLEAKDILIHLERNWNIALPGFVGDEIKSFRKQPVNDIHKERLAAIKKSIVTTETANTRNTGGQAGGNAKGSLLKAPANVIGSPNVKI